MSTKRDPDIDKTAHDASPTPPEYENAVVEQENTYAFDDSRKLGITGSVFLILNKMIGTGSKCKVACMTTISHPAQSSPLLPESSLPLDQSEFA